MSRHTPGPWMVVSDGNVISEQQGIVERIAVSIFCSKERREANARLIAAAPQMLEALEDAKLFIENGIETGYISEPQPGTPESATLPAIIAAIKAAKEEV